MYLKQKKFLYRLKRKKKRFKDEKLSFLFDERGRVLTSSLSQDLLFVITFFTNYIYFTLWAEVQKYLGLLAFSICVYNMYTMMNVQKVNIQNTKGQVFASRMLKTV